MNVQALSHSADPWRLLRTLWGAALAASLALYCSRWLYDQGPVELLLVLPSLGDLPVVGLLAALAAVVGAGAVQRPSAGRRSLRLWPLLLLNLYTGQAGPPPEAALLAGGAAAILTVASALGHAASWRVEALLAALVASVGLALYVPRLPASLLVGDSGELQVAAATLGIAHPTGYPVYLLLGKAFTLLPVGDPAYRVSLFSAATASLALAALYGAGRLAGLGRPPSAAAALLAGAGPVYWAQATRAEVYGLHLLLAGLALALSLHTAPLARRLPWACLLLGLGLAHHRTIVLLLPAVALGLLPSSRAVSPSPQGMPAGSHALSLWERVRMRAIGATSRPVSISWPVVALSFMLLILPLGSYLYLPWRWESWFGWAPQPGEMLAVAMGGAFLPFLHPAGWLGDPIRWEFLGRLLGQNLGWLAMVLAALGILGTVRRSPRVAGVLVVAAVPPLGFSVAYYVPDAEVFALPGLAALAVLAGAGAGVVVAGLDALRRLMYPMSGEAWPEPFRHGLGAAILVALAGTILPGGPPGTDPSSVPAALARRLASLELPARAIVVADVDRRAPLLYATRILSQRSDVEVVMPDTEQQVRQIVGDALAAGRPVYLARYQPDLGRDYPIHGLADLAEVRREPVWVGAASPLGRVVDGPAVASAAFASETAAGETVEVAIEWAHPGGMAGRHRPRLLLLGAPEPEGTPEDPVRGLYPTVFWRPREVVPDVLRLPIPWWLPPRRYPVALELYSAWPGSPLPMEGGGRRLVLGEIDMRPAEALPGGLTPVRAWLGEDLLLEGYRLDGPPLLGREVAVTLAGRGEPDAVGKVQVFLAGAGRTEPLVLQGAAYRDGRWAGRYAGTVQRGEDEGPSAVPRLRVVPALAGGSPPLGVRGGWAAPAGPALELRFGERATPSSALPRFDDLIELTEARLGDPVASELTSRLLPIELAWRPLARPSESLTVFVHLRRPEGPVVAQIDRPPVQGTYPTDRWQPGETVRDPYRLPLPADLAPGEYPVEVGLYRRATLERLLIADAAGLPAGDAYRVGTLVVP